MTCVTSVFLVQRDLIISYCRGVMQAEHFRFKLAMRRSLRNWRVILIGNVTTVGCVKVMQTNMSAPWAVKYGQCHGIDYTQSFSTNQPFRSRS